MQISAASTGEHKAQGVKGGWIFGPGGELPTNGWRKNREQSYGQWEGNATDVVLHGESLPKALAENFDYKREKLTKQHKGGRGARLPVSPSISGCIPPFSLLQRLGQRFLVRDLVTLQDSHALCLPLRVTKSHWLVILILQYSIINLVSSQVYWVFSSVRFKSSKNVQTEASLQGSDTLSPKKIYKILYFSTKHTEGIQDALIPLGWLCVLCLLCA